MNSKIFKTKLGIFTLAEFDSEKTFQNESVIPMKYSENDSTFELRIKLLEEKYSN